MPRKLNFLLASDSQIPVWFWCFLAFLNKAVQQNHLAVCNTEKHPRAIRPFGSALRTSHSPLWDVIGLQTGIPTGQPNSTVLMSSPMILQSHGQGPLATLGQARRLLPSGKRQQVSFYQHQSFMRPIRHIMYHTGYTCQVSEAFRLIIATLISRCALFRGLCYSAAIDDQPVAVCGDDNRVTVIHASFQKQLRQRVLQLTLNDTL